MIAFVSGIGAFNIFFARKLAFIEGFFAFFHFTAWIAVIAVLWAMTPVKPLPKAVFTEITNQFFLLELLHICTHQVIRQRSRLELNGIDDLHRSDWRHVHRGRVRREPAHERGNTRCWGRRP